MSKKIGMNGDMFKRIIKKKRKKRPTPVKR